LAIDSPFDPKTPHTHLNQDDTQAFLKAIYEPPDIVEGRLLGGDQSPQSIFGHPAEIIARYGELLRQNQQNHRNVYVGINPRTREGGGTAADVACFRCIFVDWDDCGEEEARRRIKAAGLPEPTVLVHSGHGIHAYSRLTEPITDPALWQRLQCGLIKALDSDPVVKDPPRIMRLPGFENVKRKPYVPCRIIEIDASRRYDVDIFPQEETTTRSAPNPASVMTEERFNALLEEARKQGVNVGDRAQRCIEYMQMLPASIEGRDGSGAMFRAACECYRHGLSDDEAWIAIQWYNTHKCDPAWSDAEVRHKLDDARRAVESEGQFGDRILNTNALARAQTEVHQLNVSAGDTSEGALQAETELPLIVPSKDPMVLARHFIAHCFTDPATGEIMLRRHQGTWFRFMGTHYVPLGDEAMTARLYQHLERIMTPSSNGEDEDGVALERVVPRRNLANEVLKALPACQGVLVPDGIDAPVWLDNPADRPSPRELIPVHNGLLIVESGELIPHSPLYFAMSSVPFAFNPEAPPARRWMEFLRSVFNDDEEAIQLLQEWIGYCLAMVTHLQVMLLLIGPRRSGKGTISRMISYLLGELNTCSPTLGDLANRFGLAPLLHKSLAIIEDARSLRGNAQNAALERLLSISGEDRVLIDVKGKPQFTTRLRTRIMLISNEEPNFRDSSRALLSRCLLLATRHDFTGREDRSLEDDLRAEAPSILNWGLEGYRRLCERGHFVQPASGQERLDALEAMMSPVTAFVREECDLGEHYEIWPETLYARYTEWCARQGIAHVSILQQFCKDLRSAYPEITVSQPVVNGQRPRVYRGIRLAAPAMPSAESFQIGA
jgi:putative DNA primase/helicase